MEGLKAHKMSKDHKSISIAEFFEKNKHLLGYSNLQKSLLTSVREAVDNSLDACEEAGILPDIYVEIQNIKDEEFKLIVEDNGPGIVRKNIPLVFGKLLYGSKFGKYSQSRGQQGIGISGVVMYAQLSTGKPTKIYSRIGDGKVHVFKLHIKVETNNPEIISEEVLEGNGETGIRIETFIKGKYTKGKQSVLEYLKEIAIMTPHAKITFIDPNGETFVFERAIDKLPKKAKPIKPHPHGIELGVLIRMLSNTSAKNIVSFLMTEFSKIGRNTAVDVLNRAMIDTKTKPKSMTRGDAERLLKVLHESKLQSPPTDCLSPVGEEPIKEGLKKEVLPEFTVAVSRKPAVYRGYPFQIEVGLAYGGNIDKEGTCQLYRYANKVPLLYEQGACALTKSVISTDWRRYGLKQSEGNLPQGPLVISVHFASVWVPYTSEGKEALASYPEIIKEVKLCLQEAARKLGGYLGKKKKASLQEEKRNIFVKYIPEVVDSLNKITGINRETIDEYFKAVLNTKIVDLTDKITEMQDEDYKNSLNNAREQDSESETEEDIENIFLEAKKAGEERQKLLSEIKEKEKELDL